MDKTNKYLYYTYYKDGLIAVNLFNNINMAGGIYQYCIIFIALNFKQ